MDRASQIQHQAARWVTWIDSDRRPAGQRNEFVSWLAADPRHRAAFVSIRRAWIRMDKVVRLRHFELMRANPVPVPRRRQPLRLALLAVAVVMVLGSWLRWQQGRFVEPRWSAFKTGRGALQSLTLSEGTAVTLNTDTEVQVRMSRDARTVQLIKGEALFNVAHDSPQPFVVAVGNLVIRDVGTVFSVRLRDDHDVEVLVEDGKVAVGTVTPDAGGKTHVVPATELEAGFVFETGRTRYRLSGPQIQRRLAWTSGRLEFAGEPLSGAIAEFNRYNRLQLRVDDPHIAELRLGGRFQTTNIDGFVDALRAAYSLEADWPTDGSDEIRLHMGAK
ncbi:MAG TPA: FecR domain-containing protein [Steroidobacteraceae bacterium]|jgi:transmembrane sensor